MAEPVDPEQSGVVEEGRDERRGRSRLILALLALLLLLLCVIATVADVYVSRTPEQRAFVARNIDCLKCHTELIPDMSKASVHNPFLLKDCKTCHTPHGSEVTETRTGGAAGAWTRLKSILQWLPLRLACKVYPGATSVSSGEGTSTAQVTVTRVKGGTSHLVQPEKDLCWTCHGNLGDKMSAAFQHAPFQSGYCTNCHDPHASDNPQLLRQKTEDLCKTCHPMGAELSRMQTHPPAAGWHCTDCHDPHASDNRGILVAKQRDLCFRCHPTVAPLSQKAVQHNPFMDDCTGCHEPHGANTKPLLTAEQPTLCYRCHKGIQADFEKPSHHPVGTVKLECSGCHQPHAADYEFLLTARDNSFCYQCHYSTIGVTYQASRHDANLCIRCHTPHGSVFAPLLRNRNPELCLECHDAATTGMNKHPVGPRFYDIRGKEPLTCTSTCHNPHGTQYARMLNYPYRKDGLCLKCHPAVGALF